MVDTGAVHWSWTFTVGYNLNEFSGSVLTLYRGSRVDDA